MFKWITKQFSKPIKEKGLILTVVDYPGRIASLIHKLLSRWGVVFFANFWLIYLGKIDNPYSAWLAGAVSFFLLFDKKAIDIIKEIAGLIIEWKKES